MAEFPDIRERRPEPQPPRDEVVLRARANLMNTIEQEKTKRRRRVRQVVELDLEARRRRRVRQIVASVGAACAAVAAITFVVGHDSPAPSPHTVASATPQSALLNAATQIASNAPTGNGTIRHTQFTNLTDPGHPTYDSYVRPDGTALVGKAGGALEESDGYLTSAQLATLPADPSQLRARMLDLSKELGLGFPGERPERGLYRLATELLPDPGVTPAVKAGIYRVLAGFDLTAVHARDLGVGTDRTGRRGEILELTFEEGYVDRLVLDLQSGALLSTEGLGSSGELVGGQVFKTADMVAQMPQAAT